MKKRARDMSTDFSFKDSRADFELDLTHRFNASGITAVFGPSGSGKTSLLRLMAGLDKSSNGRITFKSDVWQSKTSFLASHERNVGFVFQEPSLFEHLSVSANLDYAYKRSSKVISVERAVALTQIESLLMRSPSSLSGGEKQRISIARALCSSPQLLLMDEPLAALDKQSKQRMLPLIKSLSDELGMPIVYVSHALDEVARLADDLVLISTGEIVGSGDIHSMLTHLNYPLAHSLEAESLVDAVVAEHDQEYGLTYLESNVGRFSVAKKSLAVGERVRLMIAARDVSITKERQMDTSILNIFPAMVEEIADSNDSQVVVKVSAKGTPVLARITKKSIALLQLGVGDAVFIQAKSVALL